MIERKRNMILSKDATRVTHQPSTCIDNIIRRTIEHYEFSVLQESFSLQYLAVKISRNKRAKFTEIQQFLKTP